MIVDIYDRPEDQMVGWHYQLNGCEFEQAPRDGERQGILACCNPWGHKESNRTERLNWTELTMYSAFIFLHIPNVSLSHLIIRRKFYEGHCCPYFMGEETEVQRVHEIIMVVIRVNELGRLCRRKKKIQNTGWCLFARGGGQVKEMKGPKYTNFPL